MSTANVEVQTEVQLQGMMFSLHTMKDYAQHCNITNQVSGLCEGFPVHAGTSVQTQSVSGNNAPLAQ